MILYKYYQTHGGEEAWTPCRADTDFEEIRPTFITILACDTLLSKDSMKALVDNAKYQGSLYFDLDSADDVAPAIEGAQALWAKLQGYGLLDTDVEIFLSGKKGLHILVPQEVLMDKVEPINRLPVVYKHMAFTLAVDTLDFAVYSARKGRMFRTCYNARENGNYKVQITAEELATLTPETYQELCKAPRPLIPATPKLRPALSMVYVNALQDVKVLKKARAKPVSASVLRQHAPIAQKLMDGVGIKEDAGFNKIAIQLGLYALECKLSEDQFVEKCAGLITDHDGDGYRYNTPSKREHELRRMYNYLEDGSGYEYSLGGLTSLTASRDEFSETEDSEVEADNTGIFIKGNNYFAATEQGDRHIMDGRFKDAATLLDMTEDTIALISATFVTGNRTFPNLKIEREAFTTNSGLHKAIASKGASFTGTDIHARYIYTHMLKETKTNGMVAYATTSEGLDLVRMPMSTIIEARTPFLVWADASEVRIPKSLRDKGLRMELAPEDGPPLMKTDLIHNLSWPEFVQEHPENAEKFFGVLSGLLECQQPASIANMLGWTISCFFTQLFREAHKQFPLMHIAGPAGTGKTQMMETLMRFSYKVEKSQTFTAKSSLFSIHKMMGASASIPVVLDEYKPSTMNSEVLEGLRDAFRTCYNGTSVSRGGGNRVSTSYRALNQIELSAPVCFMAEAAESGSAILHRSILIILKRQAGKMSERTLPAWKRLKKDENLLGIFGAHIAGVIVENYTVARLEEEFNPLYEAAMLKYMPQPEDHIDEIGADLMKIKANMNERVCYNYAVAEFGLKVFRQHFELFFPNKLEEIAVLLDPLQAAHYNELSNVIDNSMPEYIKVLDMFSDMSRFPEHNPAQLAQYFDYEMGNIGGRATINIVGRSAYNKYRIHCRAIGTLALYMNAESFTQSLKNCPVFIKTGTGTKNIAQETLVLDYEDMQRKGIYAFLTK